MYYEYNWYNCTGKITNEKDRRFGFDYNYEFTHRIDGTFTNY